MKDQRSETYALIHATVHPEPGRTIDNATVLIREGRIERVTANGEVPQGYARFDLEGRHLYPGLIDIYTGYGLPDPEPRAPFSFSQPEVLETQRPGPFSVNQAVRADYRAVDHFSVNPEKARSYRAMGFSTALSFMPDGIARGAGALVSLGEGSANEMVLVPEAAALYSFDKGSSKQSYPISPMGSIALLRQTHLDAQWYRSQEPRTYVDRSLQGWLDLQDLPQIFEAGDWLSLLRADAVGDEMGQQYIIKGAGDEYRRIEAVKATGASLVVPLNFPEAKEVGDPLDARNISLTDLRHWQLAPTNPAALEAAGIPFALTSGGNDKTFWKNLRLAIERGLSEEAALAALTTRPAALLGQEDRLGRIAPGQLANLLVTSGPLFHEDTVIEDNWIAGQRHMINDHAEDHRGIYTITAGSRRFELELAGKPTSPEAKIRSLPAAEDTEPAKGKISFDDELLTLSFSPENANGAVRLTGWIDGNVWSGRGQLADGSWVDWSAQRSGDLPPKDEDPDEAAEDEVPPVVAELTYPFAPYGRQAIPEAQTVLIRNATVWTLEGDGILEDADVLIRDGKIAAVGTGLSAGNARIIDGTGLHVTPGIVDEHSHIALSGVNDVATNSGMVRMSDVVDSEDINIYRNLAGGVTAAQLLHGSANPIGGQSALIKMRWGALPEQMLIEDADRFIKFALGENVKRSGNPNSIRYPQTRMGVEQVYRDAFTQAREYRQAWTDYEALSRRQKSRTPAPRRDLALEAMADILDEDLFVTSHSYVQSEINMLMKVAEDFGFNINTFTHILEGYKVADKMAEHGAGGSTFADWWAYKWEVRYAIPYNAALMHQAGVVTAINSDSGEMSRRLNQEAAKTVKYGGLSEIEALKLVTLNPARLLHLDDRMGSIREGKDADMVIWTDHPLSIKARVKTTFVDGRPLYDSEEDRQLREQIAAERARLIAATLESGNGNGKGKGKGQGGGQPPRIFHCDSLHGFEYLNQTGAH